jgi:hypothetical protein
VETEDQLIDDGATSFAIWRCHENILDELPDELCDIYESLDLNYQGFFVKWVNEKMDEAENILQENMRIGYHGNEDGNEEDILPGTKGKMD